MVMSSPITLVPYPDVASPPPRPHEILSSPSDEITHEHEGLPRVRSRETLGPDFTSVIITQLVNKLHACRPKSRLHGAY